MCESEQVKKIWKLLGEGTEDSFNMYRCESCQQIYLNPWIVDSEFGEDPFEFTAKTLESAVREGLLTENNKPVYERLQNAYYEAVELSKKYYHEGMRVVDLGVGIGLSTLALQGSGIKADAVEANRIYAKCAKEDLGLNVICCRIEEYEGTKYDFAVLNSVIEHVHEPIEFIQQISGRFLNTGGYLIVTCPNIYSTQTISRGSEFEQFHWGHVWYYSEDTLLSLLTKCGFELIEFYRPDFTLSGIDGNAATYFTQIRGWNFNYYGAVAGIFKKLQTNE